LLFTDSSFKSSVYRFYKADI